MTCAKQKAFENKQHLVFSQMLSVKVSVAFM